MSYSIYTMYMGNNYVYSTLASTHRSQQLHSMTDLAHSSTLLQVVHVDGFGGIETTTVNEVLESVEVERDIAYLLAVVKKGWVGGREGGREERRREGGGGGGGGRKGGREARVQGRVRGREGGQVVCIYHITMHSQSTNTMTPWQLADITHSAQICSNLTSQTYNLLAHETRFVYSLELQAARYLPVQLNYFQLLWQLAVYTVFLPCTNIYYV